MRCSSSRRMRLRRARWNTAGRVHKGILPGQQKMIGFDFGVPNRTYSSKFTREEVDFYDPQVRNWIQTRAKELASAHAVHVTFDAVIFDDGRLLGDPASRLVAHFDALVQARQHAYRSVLHSLDAGDRADGCGEEIMADRINRTFRPRDTPSGTPQTRRANTIARLLERYGGDTLADVLRRAILPQPFVIHSGP